MFCLQEFFVNGVEPRAFADRLFSAYCGGLGDAGVRLMGPPLDQDRWGFLAACIGRYAHTIGELGRLAEGGPELDSQFPVWWYRGMPTMEAGFARRAAVMQLLVDYGHEARALGNKGTHSVPGHRSRATRTFKANAL